MHQHQPKTPVIETLESELITSQERCAEFVSSLLPLVQGSVSFDLKASGMQTRSDSGQSMQGGINTKRELINRKGSKTVRKRSKRVLASNVEITTSQNKCGTNVSHQKYI